MSLFDFLMSRKEFNVYQHDIHEYDHMTYTVTSFGKAFAHVRNCLLEKHMLYNTGGGFSKICVKIKKRG
jgi:hypothetical protein